MTTKISWDQVRFVWELNFVGTRSFCVHVPIDRQMLRDRIKRDGWKADDALTIDQMERLLLDAAKHGDAARSEEIRQNIRIRRTAWAVAAELLRMMLAEARAA